MLSLRREREVSGPITTPASSRGCLSRGRSMFSLPTRQDTLDPSALYSSGGTNPAFTFTLRSVPSKGIENATLVVDGQRIPAGATSQAFTWNGATAHQASLAYNSPEALQFQCPECLF